ncbi:A24 family peptidase [Frankia sp. AgPm24]|uniref:prepilin peptidase n=1 Tax=Frankia sp. AgPm24 TaxID=631128 RepID=UPI00200C787A|nr:A24 family peptidase [Frankia sp. AgPm24]MCK9923272.1 A24 family peptidase [Frankia sp. AgPm24]
MGEIWGGAAIGLVALGVAVRWGPWVVALFTSPRASESPRDPPRAWPLALVTAAVLGGVVTVLHRQPSWVPAYAWLGVVGVWLAAIDLREHRLPDPLVLPSYPVVGLLLGLAALLDDAPGRLLRAAVAGLVCFAVFLVLYRLAGGGLGRGDVKLVGLLGMALGWLGWRSVLVGMFAGIVLAGVVALGLLAARRVHRRDRLAYGPFLLAGTLLAVLATGG